MKYMMLVKCTRESEAGNPPSAELLAAIDKMGKVAIANGTMLQTGGLLPTSQACRVNASKGVTSVIDGPFAETKELVGGYAIFELKSKEEAVKIGREFMQLHADILGPAYEGQLEIRPMFDSPTNLQR